MPFNEKGNFGENKIGKYDIPKYCPKINEYFSLFCSYSEEKKIEREYPKEYLDKLSKIKKNKKKDFDFEQVPRKDHKYCHLCRVEYDNYLNHVLKDNSHKEKLKKNKPKFDRIIDTFRRIIKNQKDKAQIDSTSNKASISTLYDTISQDNILYDTINIVNKERKKIECAGKKKFILSSNNENENINMETNTSTQNQYNIFKHNKNVKKRINLKNFWNKNPNKRGTTINFNNETINPEQFISLNLRNNINN